MHTHTNARLTQKVRLRLVSQYLIDHRALADLAAEAGISLRHAYKWLARFRKVGHRITGKRQGRTAGVGYDRVHVGIETPHGSPMPRCFPMSSRAQRSAS
jgi:transposase-like protein